MTISRCPFKRIKPSQRGVLFNLGLVLTDVILTDIRLIDASGMVNQCRKSVQKAKVPSVPVDLRERSPSALSVDAFSTLSLGPFFWPFQAFGLSALSPRRFVMRFDDEFGAESTSKRRPKQENATVSFDHLEKQTQRPKAYVGQNYVC